MKIAILIIFGDQGFRSQLFFLAKKNGCDPNWSNFEVWCKYGFIWSNRFALPITIYIYIYIHTFDVVAMRFKSVNHINHKYLVGIQSFNKPVGISYHINHIIEPKYMLLSLLLLLLLYHYFHDSCFC